MTATLTPQTSPQTPPTQLFLTRLILPTRHQQVRHALQDAYHLHQFVMAGFKHLSDDTMGRILFRLEPETQNGDSIILIQSHQEPKWPENAPFEASPNKVFTPSFEVGAVLLYRLRANPTRCIPVDPGGKFDKSKRGKHSPILGQAEQAKWFTEKAARHGFSVAPGNHDDDTFYLPSDNPLVMHVVDEGFQRSDKPKVDAKMTLLSVRFEGLLRVVDPTLFAAALAFGIGRGKGLGFGLLSVRRP